ncbi:GTP cyclohydrolase I [Agreia bicolorata]|uniref:GTP cyclohydrolase 1 n=1 Tax=Agreia bicolorata TaxID=110935 RepID=A0A1T4XL95_9MICO|nr:GTP cyclohydrolase I [Agreia bicolorata]KJC65025.1 GTP cyclohydrolase [Agreia bicolorata]SKA90163.1 GTP cyclohydrolase I [Agreia bicolorata]
MTAFDRARVEAAVHEILIAIGEDPERGGLERTPARVADAYEEFFSGLGVDPASVLGDTFAVPDGAAAEPVLVRGIEFRSVCEHHLLPFTGVAHVAYIPSNRLIGLGRIASVVDALASRPQLQERLGDEIASAIESGVDARGVLVVLDAQHDCVRTRGPRQTRSSTVTVSSRGTLSQPAERAELMSLIGATT